MFKNSKPSTNISTGVQFLLRGARKRRSMAYANIKTIQSELGIAPKLAAVK